ncbi:hypothetical protein HK096_003543, partial [Nowakowskiella sp. JEL0078]
VENRLNVYDHIQALQMIRSVREYCIQLEDAINIAFSTSNKGKGKSSATFPVSFPSSTLSNSIHSSFADSFTENNESSVPDYINNFDQNSIVDSPLNIEFEPPINLNAQNPQVINDQSCQNQFIPSFPTIDFNETPKTSTKVSNISRTASNTLPRKQPKVYTSITSFNFEQNKIYVAFKNFIAVNPEYQINLKAGDMLQCTSIEGDFVFGTNLTTAVGGFFPLECIGNIQEATDDPAFIKQEINNYDHIEPIVNKPTGRYLSIASYKPSNDLEVAMEVGDELDITSWVDETCALGLNVKSGIEGKFPSHLIKYIGPLIPNNNERESSLVRPLNVGYEFENPNVPIYNVGLSPDDKIQTGVPIMIRVESSLAKEPTRTGGIGIAAPTTPIITQLPNDNANNMIIDESNISQSYDRDEILAHIAAYQIDYSVALKLYMDQLNELKNEGKEVPLTLNLELMRQLTSNMAVIPRGELIQSSGSQSHNTGSLNSINPANSIYASAVIPRSSTKRSYISQSPPRRGDSLFHNQIIPDFSNSEFETKEIDTPIVFAPTVYTIPVHPQPNRFHDSNSSPTGTNHSDESKRKKSQSENPAAPVSPKPKSPEITTKEINRRAQPTVTERMNKRKGVIQELYQTEKNYRDELKILTDAIMKPILQGNFLDISQSARISKALNGVTELYNLSVKVCSQLGASTESAEGDALPVARIFLEHVDEWNSYIKYVENYSDIHNSVRGLEKSTTHGTKFKEFQEKLLKRPECGKKDIYHFLIIPIKRIGHYFILLSTLKKHVEQEVSVYIEAAENYMWQIGSILNQAKKREEQIEKMFKVYHSVQNCPPNILSQSKRQFIKQFEIMILTPFTSTSGRVVGSSSLRTPTTKHQKNLSGSTPHLMPGAELTMFLFSDSFLVVSPRKFTKSSESHKHIFEKWIKFEDISIDDKYD